MLECPNSPTGELGLIASWTDLEVSWMYEWNVEFQVGNWEDHVNIVFKAMNLDVITEGVEERIQQMNSGAPQSFRFGSLE